MLRQQNYECLPRSLPKHSVWRVGELYGHPHSVASTGFSCTLSVDLTEKTVKAAKTVPPASACCLAPVLHSEKSPPQGHMFPVHPSRSLPYSLITCNVSKISKTQSENQRLTVMNMFYLFYFLRHYFFFHFSLC